jgi:hypothetical protein
MIGNDFLLLDDTTWTNYISLWKKFLEALGDEVQSEVVRALNLLYKTKVIISSLDLLVD